MDQSLRRLGHLLVVMGALLGAVIGVASALIVENAEASRAPAAPEGGRVASLAAGLPSSQPPASRAASSEASAAGGGPSGNQRAELADRADQRGGKADKNSEGRRDKPGKGKGKDK